MKNRYQASYFYLPASEERPAELIEILNCDKKYVQVPMREEDIVLEAFFVRDMTEKEIQNFSNTQVWQIFASWGELLEDHLRYHVDNFVLLELGRYKNEFPLPEGMAA